VSERPESVHLQLEEEVVVVEGVADVRRRGGRERWKWQSDFSLAILVVRPKTVVKALATRSHLRDADSMPPSEHVLATRLVRRFFRTLGQGRVTYHVNN